MPFINLAAYRSVRRPSRPTAASSARLAAAAAAVLLWSGATQLAEAADCPGLEPPVRVTAADPADAAAACTGASRAYGFLKTHGLAPRGAVIIRVEDALDDVSGAPVAGIYDRESGIVSVLARSAVAVDGDDTLFTVPMDDDLYASVFAHEVTHAVVEQQDHDNKISPAAHEYVAYTVQLATLPAASREKVLRRFPGPGFTAPAQINTVVLAMDPHRFAANAYRHFRRTDATTAESLQAVLATPEDVGLLGE